MNAAQRIEALQKRNPAAAELALLICLAVRVEPELLRRARLMIGADAAAEADLWWSDLVSAQNADGLMLDPEVSEVLRARLAEPQRRELRDASWALIRAQHADGHLAARLEELVNWLSIGGGDDAEERIEELLVAGVNEWMTSANEPSGGVRWILSALRRLPRVAAQSPAATLIGVAATTHAGGEVPRLPADAALPADALDNWYPWLLARLPTTSITVALVDGGIEFEGSAEHAHTLIVPDTDPVQLEVSWQDVAAHRRQVRVYCGERTTLALNADEVELATLAGRRSTLRRRGRPAGIAGLDFASVRARYRPAVGLEDVVERILHTVRDVTGWVAVGGDAGSGKTTALCAALDALEAKGFVVLQHFYGRGPSWWDDHENVARSLVAQLSAAVPDLPTPLEDAVSRPGVSSGVSGPGAQLERLLTIADERGGPRIVVALDDPPADGIDELKLWLFIAPFPSRVPLGCCFVVTSRYASAVRDYLEDGDPYGRVEISDQDTRAACEAYIRRHWDSLVAKLGLPTRPVVATSGEATPGLLRQLKARGFEPIACEGHIREAIERSDAGVILLGDSPDPTQFTFGRLCRDRRRPLVVIVVGEETDWDRTQAVAGGRLDVADRLLARDLGAWASSEAGAGRAFAARFGRAQDLGTAEARVAQELEHRLRALVWPFADELVALGGATIEGVRTLVDWIVAQPHGITTLEDAPATMTGSMDWSRLTDPIGRRITGAVAVAKPGFTVADALWATPVWEWSEAMNAIMWLRNSNMLDDPEYLLAPRPPADVIDLEQQVEAFGHAPLRSADPALAARVEAEFGAEALVDAHRWLATAQRQRVGAATTSYIARHAMAHAVAAGDIDVIRGLCDVSALTQQARRLGLDAVAADVALARTLVDDRALAAVQGAVSALAARDVPAADFARQLYHELAVRVGGQEASYHLHPHQGMRPLLEAWEPLGESERAIAYTDITALIEREGGAAVVSNDGEVFALLAAEPWDLRRYFPPEARLVGTERGRIVAVVSGSVISAGPRGDVWPISMPDGHFAFDWAASIDARLLAATADGALVHWSRLSEEGEPRPRVLLAHTGALACVAAGPHRFWERIARAAVVKVLVNERSVGHGVFVGEGIILLAAEAANAIGPATRVQVEINDRAHAAEVLPGERPALTLLKVDVRGHATVPLAAPRDTGNLKLDRHRVIGPSQLRDGMPITLRRRDPSQAGAASTWRRFEESGLGGFVFARGGLYAVISSPRARATVAAEPVAPLLRMLGDDRPALRSLTSTSSWFATGSLDGTVAVWTSDDDKPILRYHGHGAPVRTLTAVGRFLASGGDDGTLRLWTPDDGRDVAVHAASGAAITASAEAWDGLIAWGAADGSLGIWDTGSGWRSQALAGHAGCVSGLIVYEDTLISWAVDGAVAIWSRDHSEPQAVFDGPAPVRHVVRMSATALAVLWGDGAVTVEDPFGDTEPAGAACLAVSADGEQIARGVGSELLVARRRRPVGRHAQDAPPIACTFAQTGPASFRPIAITAANLRTGLSPGPQPTNVAAVGSNVAIGLADGTIVLNAVGDAVTPRGTRVGTRDDAAVSALAGDDALLVSGHQDGTIRVWELPDGQRLICTLTQRHPVDHVAIVRNHLAAADGSEIRLWDFPTGLPLHTLAGHEARVSGLATIAGPRDDYRDLLVSCDEDGVLRLWDLTANRHLETFHAARPLVAVAVGGFTVAARDAVGNMYAWSVRRPPHGPPPNLAAAVAHRPFELEFNAPIRRRLHGALLFDVDVELRAIRSEPTPAADHWRFITRVAVDQPEGFWDERDEDGAFVAPPLIVAGRGVEVRIEQRWENLSGRVQLTKPPAPGSVFVELWSPQLDEPLRVPLLIIGPP